LVFHGDLHCVSVVDFEVPRDGSKIGRLTLPRYCRDGSPIWFSRMA
jgi:hypothetical protein